MRLIIDSKYSLRGWYKSPTGVLNEETKEARFVDKQTYLFLLKCDGAHDIDPDALTEEEKKIYEEALRAGIIREAIFGEYIKPEQEYKTYPARYRRNVHWSITGACNLKCRHCFMSAPHAKHGSPSLKQLLNIADQLAECGVFTAGITGGEPLIRGDFFQLIDAMCERNIKVNVIYTNGWLVDEKLLDELEKRKMHPAFQLSFDGVGMHDFLRGIDGAEEKTLNALKLLQERKYVVSVSMSMHRKNASTLRETVKLLASYGVKSMKCGKIMELGEWASPDLKDIQLSRQESLELFESYVPQYFEDNAPLSIMLDDTFMYTPGDSHWDLYDVRECPAEDENDILSCGVTDKNFYIGADGMVAPCMGMCDCGFASHFPNLFDTPLKDILRDSEYTDLCATTVGDIRNHNPKCRSCKFVDRCTGGCRNTVLLEKDDYRGIDEEICYFFENGWEERFGKAAEEPFKAYLERNGIKQDNKEKERTTEIDMC